MPKKKYKYYVRPDGLHETIRKINGKRVAFRGRSDREVDQKIAEYNAALETAKDPLFRDVSAAWEEDHLPTLSPNTARNYKAQNKIVTEHFGDRRISEIEPADIQAYLSSHKTQARKTVTNRLLTLNLIFNFAILQGYIRYNPCISCRIPKGLKVSHRAAPTEKETAVIKKFAADPDGLMAALILCTGCRKGEAMGLLTSDIDRKAKALTISRSIYFDGNKPRVKSPKSTAGYRTTPLPDFLLKLLPRGTGKTARPLFPSAEDPTAYMTQSQYKHMWERWQKKTGLQLSAHQIRHGYATILYEAGIQAKDAQVFLGHAQLSTTMDIYTHIRQDRLTKTNAAVNKAINSIK